VIVQTGVSNGHLAVSCRGVAKEFGRGNARVQALRGVDLDVHLGAMTLLVGPSGCGKTTFLSVITGLLDPTAGQISVLGVEVTSLSNGQKIAFRRSNLGFVFQQFNLLPALTAAENVAVPLLAAGVRRAEAVARAADLLATLKMADRARAAWGALGRPAAAGRAGASAHPRASADRL
jgi:putative ABC transport system ATP-binding protein